MASFRAGNEVHNPLASRGCSGRKVVLGHTVNTQTLMKIDEQRKVLSKFTILCWAVLIVIPGRMQPASHRLDAPERTVLLR